MDVDRIKLGDIEGEFRRLMQNVEAVLKSGGSDLDDAVQTRTYVRDENDSEEYNDFQAVYFTDPKPARTTIIHCLSDKLRYEIECIAVLRE